MNERNFICGHAAQDKLLFYIVVKIETVLRRALVKEHKLGQFIAFTPDSEHIFNACIKF